MPRRHKPPESNHPHRWMVSYADFMTLLFAFFVVMYAVSVVNNQKFERMSHALVGLFESPSAFPVPIKLADILPPVIYQPESVNHADEDHMDIQDLQNNLQALVQENINSLLKQPEFNLEMSNDWLQIEVQGDQFFQPGKADLTLEGEQVLVTLAKTFLQFEKAINIEVFTDTVGSDKINNWQLSALQGSAIAQLLTMEGIVPERLGVSAFGPYHPVATSDDEEGRSINRRVNFMIDRTGTLRDRTKIVTNRHLSAKPIIEAVN